MRSLGVRLASRTAAGMFGAAAALLALAAALEPASARAEIAGLAGCSLALCALLLALERTGHATLGLSFAADLMGVGIVVGLVALTDGVQSHYWPYLILPMLHAAVFQPLGRTVAVTLAGLLAFAAPLAYDRGEADWFTEVEVAAALPAVIAIWVVHLVVRLLRRDQDALAMREAEAMRIAESDELTGIGNYRRFWRALQSEVARARRHDQPFSLIVLDLDGFKAINDQLGHQAGDEALRRVARALEGELRAEDVLCRQGGDEFAVIAVAAGEAEAGELAHRLEEAVARSGGRGLSPGLSASAGWATFGEPEQGADGLLARADSALRESKRVRGRGDRPPAERPPPPPAGREPRRRPGRRLAALSACSRALALAQDERAVARIAVVHVAEALEATSVELWRCAPDTPRPALVARGRHTGSDGRGVAPVDAGVVNEVMARNHVATLPGGGLIVPISHPGRVDGALACRPARSEQFGLEERRLALAMAAQIGRALVAATARAAVEEASPRELAHLAEATGAGQDAAQVAELAVAAGAELGLEEAELDTLRRAALLHNVGMIGVPAGLPLRPAPLTPEEVEVVREHPIIAERLLRTIPPLSDSARILRHAHEHHDGSGYPDGLAGADIPLASRILHAAIAYAAMRSPRPWRAALTEEATLAELRAGSGSQLDPEVVDALLRARGRNPVAG